MIRVILLGITGDQIPLSLGESGSVTPIEICDLQSTV